MSGNNFTILAAGTFVRGDVYSDDVLVVEGGVEGNIVGNRVSVKASGWLHGNLTCRSLSIEPGGIVDGAVRVSSSLALPPHDQARPDALPAGQNSPSLAQGDTPSGDQD
ncbi:MAG: polymer-forming cytoskeletal protein [Deltaproteobacteria bacterium]|nr:polymer-forming cytoskeletal protein [Deltaproteobacteria bacterium]